MSKILNATVPSDNWTLPTLGRYVVHHGAKTVEAIWKQGRAFSIAKSKARHGQWRKWQEEFVPHLSASTISNYRKVGELSLEEITGKSIAEVYTLLGLGKKPVPTPVNVPTATTADQTTVPVATPEVPVFKLAHTTDVADPHFQAVVCDRAALDAVEVAVTALARLTGLPALAVPDAVRLLVRAMKSATQVAQAA